MSQPISKKEAIVRLWNKGIIHWKLEPVQKDLYDSFRDAESKIVVWSCSRRLGKCLKEGSLIATPQGPRPIETLKIGDLVYGYNLDGSISTTPVLDVFFQGEKEVVDLIHGRRVLESSTLDHRWLSFNTYSEAIKEKKLGDFSSRDKIIRKFINFPGGTTNEPHAYAIGALLGDGCSRQGVQKIHISSEDSIIPNKVASILEAQTNQCPKNYTHVLSVEGHQKQYSPRINTKLHCNYYDSWCRGKYAHEKIIDLEIIKQWDRSSCLNLLAGLIDTDGTVSVNGNILTVGFHSQSRSLMEAVSYLIHTLVQYKPTISKERKNKYKNGPLYYTYVRNNLFSKKLLKELSPFLVTPRKKWKESYAHLNENNSTEDHVGITLSVPYKARCWDISIGNDTHMYLTANGLVTHNSFALSCIAIEKCLQKPNTVVKFVAPSQRHVKMIIKPIFKKLIEDCPLELKPEFRSTEGLYRFPNGSEIQLAGTDSGNAESLRGGSSDLCIVDEAGFCDDLRYIVQSILIPTTTTTRGKIILSSTPPTSPDHEFVSYIKSAELKGNYIKKTIYDCIGPRINQEIIDEIIEELNGADSPDFRREYLCELIVDEDHAVVPEFSETLAKEIVKPWVKPAYHDIYCAGDIGFKDLTVFLFAYYDFRAAKLIVEDELVMNGKKMTTDYMAKQLKQKELELWVHPLTGEQQKPYLRVCDNNLIVINDLRSLHNLDFIPVAKDDAEAALNNMRIMLKEGRIIINPRCKTLIYHLKYATWKKNKKIYDRSPDAGHYDAVDALKYLVRNVQYSKNPYPSNYGRGSSDSWFNLEKRVTTELHTKVKDIFTPKKTGKLWRG